MYCFYSSCDSNTKIPWCFLANNFDNPVKIRSHILIPLNRIMGESHEEKKEHLQLRL